MPFTPVSAERETAVVPDNPKVAVSAAALGTVAGVQLPAVFQSPDPGTSFHVELPARAEVCRRNVSAAKADR